MKKKHLKMTASESKTFTTFLPLIIGPLIPQDDEVWEFLCTLFQILHIVLLREIHYEMIDALRLLVEKHHKEYLRLFKDTLKQKHHNLTHYPEAILKSGALRLQWVMRYEAKHREPKQYSRVNYNRRNSCYSLAIKAGLKFAYNLMNAEFVQPKIHFESADDGALTKFVCQGSIYEVDTIFLIQKEKQMNIFQICEIFVDNDQISLKCKSYFSELYDNHLQSYELTMKSNFMTIHDIDKFYSKPINLHEIEGRLLLRCCNYYDLNETISGLIVS